MITIGKAAKILGISRTTILYYESIGVLNVSKRGKNSYRLYDEKDIERLKQVVELRKVGISCKEIFKIPEMEVSSILLKRLNDMNKEIQDIKRQQNVIIKLLASDDLKIKRSDMNKEEWHSILKNAGISDETAYKWHADFEKSSPEQHENFLQVLGFTPEEIEKIRMSES